MTHPITPPPELVQQWRTAMTDAVFVGWKNPEREKHLCVVAAQWGADQELEACTDWLANARNHTLSWNEATNLSANLRAARRPKPPSLKEQALAELAEWENVMDIAPDSPIRRALEALPE